MDFRSFFKPAGTNPEIEGPYYELSSFAVIVGHSNFEAITLGFKKGEFTNDLWFGPADPTKPIVLAITDSLDGTRLYEVAEHLQENTKTGMKNFKPFKSDEFVFFCTKGYSYLKKDGMTFVFGETTFPDTWHLRDADLLCAFVAGELTTNQLRMHAYLSDREAVKEERCEAHIMRLTEEVQRMRDNYTTQCDRMTARWFEKGMMKRVRLIANFYLADNN